jgi:hypothetical protein
VKNFYLSEKLIAPALLDLIRGRITEVLSLKNIFIGPPAIGTYPIL